MKKKVQYRWWRDAPSFVRRVYWKLILSHVGLFAGVIVILVANVQEVLGLWWSLVVFGTLATILPLSIFVGAQWEKRLMARLEAAAYMLCPKCGHRLTGLTGRTACPECGAACEITKVQDDWRAFHPRILGPFV